MIYKFGIIEKLLLNANIIPHPLADSASNVGLAKALILATKLGITDKLSLTPQSASSLAKECNISTKGCVLILDCLEALGYVTKSEDQFSFNKRGKKFLDPHSPDSFKYFILFSGLLLDSYSNLEQTIINGKGSLDNFENYNEHEWELFSRAMIEISRSNLSEIIGKIKIQQNAKKIIDLGGGHGQYSIGLCQKKADLKATILDFEPVRKYADECISKANIKEQVKFKACNFITENIPDNTDIALLFNIIHGFEKEDNIKLFHKVFESLNNGGQLVILDQINGIGGKSQMSRSTTSFMALNLFHQANGNTFSYSEIEEWTTKVGFKSCKLKKLNAPGFGLIICQK